VSTVVSYLDLNKETVWRDERTPDSLLALASQLVRHFGIPASAVGTRGDNNHLSGYHRSRRWIRESIYCTDRRYSVTRTPGNVSGGDGNHVAALDLSLPTTQLMTVCRRLDAAVRSGQLEKVTEWYGNVNGDQRVDGYDNIANVLSTSDSSHLTHLHLSFDRGRVSEDHGDVFAILTGVTHVTIPDADLIAIATSVQQNGPAPAGPKGPGYNLMDHILYTEKDVAALVSTVDALRVAVIALTERPVLDPLAFATALVHDEGAMEIIGQAVAARVGIIPTAEEISRGVWRTLAGYVPPASGQ